MHKKNLHLQGLDQASPLQAVVDPHGPCRGDANLGAELAITLMITARESTGQTLSSKLVVRGPREPHSAMIYWLYIYTLQYTLCIIHKL